MPEVWSINTTVRNPERLKDFLKVLAEFEGQDFNYETQALYQKALVKNKLFKPNDTPDDLKMEYDNPEKFSDEDTETIFNLIKKPDFRGRTSVSKLNQMGLAIALKSQGAVVITELGRDFINGDFSKDQNLFFNYFVKWQLPNPIDSKYNDDFDINPFLSTLYTINKVNDLEELRGNKRKGISKKEFALFIITLKNYKDIDEVCEKIIKFRAVSKKSADADEFFNQELDKKVIEIYGVFDKKEINTKSNNLKDYADSAIRWFRKTQYIIYRGVRNYVDISPTRLEQAKQLINRFSLSSNHYKDKESYRKYLVNKDLPKLPWESDYDTKKAIITNLGKLIQDVQNKIDLEFPNKRIHNFSTTPHISQSMSLSMLRELEREYRKNYNTINNELRTLKESDLKNLSKYIIKLSELSNLGRNNRKVNAPLCLEWYTSLSLMALDDSLEIKPNMVRADDGLPLFTAVGGVPDIECFYESFNLMVEVTLMKGRNQVQNEVLPISRHFVDMKKKYTDKMCYCLFLAPMIHRDTLNHFYFYINNTIEGEDLNLIPLTIEQYVYLLKVVLKNNEMGKLIDHCKFEEFFQNTLYELKNENNSTKWYDIINESIIKWGDSFV